MQGHERCSNPLTQADMYTLSEYTTRKGVITMQAH